MKNILLHPVGIFFFGVCPSCVLSLLGGVIFFSGLRSGSVLATVWPVLGFFGAVGFLLALKRPVSKCAVVFLVLGLLGMSPIFIAAALNPAMVFNPVVLTLVILPVATAVLNVRSGLGGWNVGEVDANNDHVESPPDKGTG